MMLEEFKNKFELLNEQMKNEFSDVENDRYPIYDGPVSCEKYFNSPLKIVWLLKEAYDGENGTGGDWSFGDLVGSETVYENFIKSHPSRATWHPIVYTSYSLLNGLPLRNEMNDIRDEPEMCLAIQNVAFINALKLPAMNVTKSNNKQIEELFTKYKDINTTQLEILDADIIICGSTFSLYRDILGIKDEEPNINCGVHYYFKNKKLIINAYHPAQRNTISKENYVNGIVLAVKEWYKNRVL